MDGTLTLTRAVWDAWDDKYRFYLLLRGLGASKDMGRAIFTAALLMGKAVQPSNQFLLDFKLEKVVPTDDDSDSSEGLQDTPTHQLAARRIH